MKRRLACPYALCAAGLAAVTSSEQVSANTFAPSNPCDAAARKSAERTDVPLEILQSIARVESGRMVEGQLQPWPWAINQAGQGHWFADQAGAIAYAEDQFAQGNEDFDIGCFQINLHWHGSHFESLESAIDPQTNADYAARFLSELLQSEGSWAAAVAAYHSRTVEEGQNYLGRVEATLVKLRGDAPIDETPYTEATAIARENRFPLLRAGAHGVGASLVPVVDAGVPLVAATN